MENLDFFIVWNFGTDIQISSQPLNWYYHTTISLLRGDLPLVHKIKLRRDIHYDVMLTIIDLPVFPNIESCTTCHVHQCEILNPERLLSVATMINSWWWRYN